MTEMMRVQIMDQVMAYGVGASTLRCLAFATVDNPIPTSKMNLQDPSTFCEYEVLHCNVLAAGILKNRVCNFKLNTVLTI